METSHAVACTTRAGVRCTGCQCLKSIGRGGRHGCRLCVVSAVKAACRPATSPPQCDGGQHAPSLATSPAGRQLQHPKLTTPAVLCVASACALAAGAGGDLTARRPAVPAVSPHVPRRRDDIPSGRPCQARSHRSCWPHLQTDPCGRQRACTPCAAEQAQLPACCTPLL